MPRTAAMGSGAPSPTACERTRFSWSSRTSVAEMRVSARAPKPVFTP